MYIIFVKKVVYNKNAMISTEDMQIAYQMNINLNFVKKFFLMKIWIMKSQISLKNLFELITLYM